METHAPKKRIYFDGTCTVCTAAADAYASPEHYERHDVTKDDLPQGVSLIDAMKYMHVIEADGTMYRGADAVFSVMDDQVWKWVAKIGRLPGLRLVARMMYRVVATHRYLLNRSK